MKIWSLLKENLQGYEEREQQKQLSAAIYSLFADRGGQLLAEGPCGVGKSMAYLLAFVEAYPKTAKRILVLTSNNTLLGQLYKKDLPLMENIALLDGKSIEWVMLQGKSNYFCRKVLHKRYFEGKTLIDGLPQESQSEWSTIHDELMDLDEHHKQWLGHIEGSRAYDFAKSKYTIPSQKCGMSRCPDSPSCELAITRSVAPDCHVIAANYHLWLIDAMTSLFSPEYVSVFGQIDAIVFDEAHELPEVARDYFALHLSDGFIENIAQHLQESPLQILRMAWKMYRHAWAKEPNGLTLFRPDKQVAEAMMGALQSALAFIASKNDKSDSDYRCIDELDRRMMLCSDAIVGEVSMDTHAYGIEWKQAEGQKEKDFSMKCVEVSPGRILQKLIPKNIPVIALSATMTTGAKDFSFIQSQIGMPSAKTIAVSSPFDTAKSTIFCIDNAPDPNDEEKWVEHCANIIHNAADIMHGRMLCLFTSTHRMMKAAQIIRSLNPRYDVLAQGDASTSTLTKQFRDNKHAILLGVNSFWTGLDVKGDSLAVVFIERLPFLSPTDTINQAQSRRLGKKAFFQFALPHAMIRLRQGVGRLLRGADDFGVVLFADGRLKTKAYGKTVLNQVLPGAKVQYGKLFNMTLLLHQYRNKWIEKGVVDF